MAHGHQPPTANDVDANGNEVPTPAVDTTIGIRFQNQHGDDVHFKLKPNTKLCKAMDAYSARTERDPKSLRFLFEGVRVLATNTPDDLEMDDGCTVDVHEEQIGGGAALPCVLQ